MNPWDYAIDFVLKYEGKYINHPSDPGGPTNMGITLDTLSAWRGYRCTVDDVKNLTRGEAVKIYKKNYWDKIQGDFLPAGLAIAAMDAAVNSGVNRSSRWLQRAVKTKDDGKVGMFTIEAAQNTNQRKAIETMVGYRLAFLRKLKTYDHFGRGWEARVKALLILATDPKIMVLSNKDGGSS